MGRFNISLQFVTYSSSQAAMAAQTGHRQRDPAITSSGVFAGKTKRSIIDGPGMKLLSDGLHDSADLLVGDPGRGYDQGCAQRAEPHTHPTPPPPTLPPTPP